MGLNYASARFPEVWLRKHYSCVGNMQAETNRRLYKDISNCMNLQRTWRKNFKIDNVTKGLTTLLFIIYLIAICWILLFKLGVRFSYMGKRRVNLIPFVDLSILNPENVLNVLIFVPLGIYLGVLFARWVLAKKLFFFFLLSLIIEGLQYVFGAGAFDVTDIITNTSGGIIGLILFKAIERGANSSVKAQKFINIIAATGTALMILLLVLLKLNMLPIRYQ
jgi:glycopeptide antibiotics resistance protein